MKTTIYPKSIKAAKDHSTSPLRYMYEICDYADLTFPMFPDKVKGGYRLRRFWDSKEDAYEYIDIVAKAADDLGIELYKNIVKPNNTWGHKGAWMSFTVVPRYEPEEETI